MVMMMLSMALGACAVGPVSGDLDGEKASVQSVPADFVKLYYAKALGNYKNNALYGKVKGFIEIADVAYNKKVMVRYIVAGTSTWIDVPAYFVKDHYNKEVWQFDLSDIAYDGLTFDIQFCIYYTVNGQTYWDNNDGKNYRLLMQSGQTLYSDTVLGKSLIALSHATAYIYSSGAYDSVFTGQVTIADLGHPNRMVDLVYTTDGWNTTHTAIATPGYTGNELKELYFNFYTSVPASTTQIDFALSYNLNYQFTTWDNNFLANYRCSIPAGEVRGSDVW